MSELEHNLPDDFWRKAFDEASEAPPSRVWDTVERRLDEDNDTRILPLWRMGQASSRPFIWGMGVAAVIALLLVGRWAFWSTGPDEPVALRQPQTQERGEVSSARDKAGKNSAQKDQPNGPLTSDEGLGADVAVNRQTLSGPAGNKPAAPVGLSAEMALTEGQRPDQPATESPALPTTAPVAELPKAAREQPITDAQPASVMQQTLAPSAFQPDMTRNKQMAFADQLFKAGRPSTASLSRMAIDSASSAKTAMVNEPVLSFDPVRTSSLRLREPGAIQRIVWLSATDPVTEAATGKPKRTSREVWASVSIMPGAFDPSVTVRAAQASFAPANTLTNANVSQPSVSSRANFSVAYQAGAGIQLNEHWSVESGVGYLAGRSTVESPVQASVLNNLSASASTTGQYGNLYVDALRSSLVMASSAQQNTMASPVMAGLDNTGMGNRNTVPNTYSLQTRQSLTNDYQFIQVPVQVGYQLRPRKRLGMALLGGFLSNLFVRNTVGNELVITTRDGVYRPVSWVATLGARVRYRPSRQWSASLAGIYQPSLGFGTRPESAVQSQPTSTGMSFGIDYHF